MESEVNISLLLSRANEINPNKSESMEQEHYKKI